MKIIGKILLATGTLSLLSVGDMLQITKQESQITYKTPEEILSVADTNYTRTTATYFTAAAFTTVTENNYFSCFTQTRKTLWTSHALYMHNDTEQVNSGYLDKNGTMSHYTLHNGYQDIAKKDKGLVENIRDDYVSEDTAYTIHDYFVGCHTFKSQATSIAAYFSAVDGKNGVYQATESSLFQNFMYFCAPLYTNPIVEGASAFLTFTKVELVDLTDGTYQYNLYASETEKLSQSSGLFASATISSIGSTSLSVVDAYLA